MESPYPDPLVWTAYVVGLFTVTLVVLLLFAMTAWRAFTRVRHRSANRLRTKWMEILRGGHFSLQADLSAMPRETAFTLMHEWNVVFDQTRILSDSDALDAAQEQLRIAGDQAGIEAFALDLLESGSNDELVAACMALGNMRASRAWIGLRRRAAIDNAFISVAAVEAMVRIDPARALSSLADGLLAHPHWPDHVLSRMFREIPEPALHDVIRDVASSSSFECVLRTFSALDRIDHDMAIVLLEWLFKHAGSDEELVQWVYASFQDDHTELAIERLHDVRASVAGS